MGVRRKLLATAAVLAAVGAAAGWLLSAPRGLDDAVLSALQAGDATRGERVFWAGGCVSCHAAPGAEGDEKLKLVGGVRLATPFGTFVGPNISQDAADGIGTWTVQDLANAMQRGVSPEGSHYYPAFPYTSYARMKPEDIGDLFAFLKTLPAVAGRAPDHELAFPFSVRRGIGLWKLVNLDPGRAVDLPADASAQVLAGQYLVEGPGHCGECHTPRDFAGGTDNSRWLSGAVAAEGNGVVPNITGGEGGIGAWSAGEIAYYLESGFTPDFDSAGGSMAEVQRNIARLPAEDREAIAAYLKAIPAHPNGYPPRP